jgi:glycogen operon protein
MKPFDSSLTPLHLESRMRKAVRLFSLSCATSCVGVVLALVVLACPYTSEAAGTSPGGTDDLGAQLSLNGSTVTFRVYSQSATRIEVNLYAQATGAAQVASYALTPATGSAIWQVAIPSATLRGLGFDIDPGNPGKLFTNIYYGYRAWGPNWPYSRNWTPGSAVGFIADVDSAGNRFNPNKLLLDPYALEMSHDYLSAAVTPAQADPTVYTSGTSSLAGAVPDRQRDSAKVAPKGIVAMPYGLGFGNLFTGTKPARAAKDDIIVEAHVRGLTQGDASVGNCKGTYAGAVAKIPYLTAMGINAIEFMPVHETENQANDLNDTATGRAATNTKEDNYWGYMTSSFFAPDRRYACDKSIGGPTREFAAMVKAFHDAGIKVVADVVYNHSAEGGTWSSTDPSKANMWSMRGLDNASYYLLTRAPGTARDRNFYYDITGTGNTLNTHHPKVQDLILNSLNYYRNRLGIDGFRFDLGIALVNTYDNNTDPLKADRFNFDRLDNSTAMAKVTAAMPGVFLSSEPWGLAPNGQGYQLGNMPAGISEWNGAWRDSIRRASNKYGVHDEDATRGTLATRIAGSSDLFGKTNGGRGAPWYSVNFLNVHDGFTLKDLYSCSSPNNQQAWPMGPSDGGSADEDQWDNGANAQQQRQQARTAFALLMLSAGVPLFNAGDEFLRSLSCNNNPYNVDSASNWLQWTLSADQSNFQSFAKGMIQLRLSQPALRPAGFYAPLDGNGNSMRPLDWFGADKAYRSTSSDNSFWQATAAAPDANNQNRTLMWRYDSTELGGSDILLVAYNAEPVARTFTLPWTGPTKNTWCRMTDTAAWAEGSNQVDLGAANCVGGENSTYGVQARSLVIFKAK